MITDRVYNDYLDLLLQGRRLECGRIVQDLIDRGVDIRILYTDLFQKSLYAVGDLWERNRISVAREHLATAVTEGLLNQVYPVLFDGEREQTGKSVVVSCAANEFHQIGGKMVADLFEYHGWEGHFLGAGTPVDEMLAFIEETKPDMVGLSLSVYFNLASLKTGLAAIRANFRNLDILVGGQAFRWGGVDTLKRFSGTEYVPSLDDLEHAIR